MSGDVELGDFPQKKMECTVCQQDMLAPRLLPCLHSLCSNCLRSTIDSNRSQGQITCHTCSEVVTIPPEDIEGFPLNVYLTGEIGVFTAHNSKNKPCEICVLKKKNTTATSMCIDCGDLLCESCGPAHSSTRMTIAHRVTPFKDVDSGAHDADIRKINFITCPRHDREVLHSFCEDCDMLICRECHLISHFNHSCNHVDDLDMGKHTNVTRGVQHIEKKMKILSTIETGVDETLTGIDKQEKEIIGEVEHITNKLMEHIQNEKTGLVEKVKRQMEAQRTLHEEHKNDVVARFKQMGDSVNFCNEVIQKAKNEEVLFLEPIMVGRLQYLDSLPRIKQEITCQYPEIRLKNIFGSVENIRFFDFLPGPPSSVSLLRPDETNNTGVPRVAHLQIVKKINTFTADDETTPKITGLGLDGSDRVIVCDNANRKIKLFMANGKYIETVHKCKASSMAVSDGVIATSDHFQLLFISSDYIRKVTMEGNSASYPIASYEGIHFILADTRHSSFCVYDKFGEQIKSIPIPKTKKKARHRNITFIASNSKGEVIVSDWGTNAVILIDSDGHILQEFKAQDATPRDWAPGQICVDIHDNIFIADHQRGSVLALNPSFQIIYKHSTKKDYLERPMHLCFDSNGNLLVSGKSGIVNVYSCKYI